MMARKKEDKGVFRRAMVIIGLALILFGALVAAINAASGSLKFDIISRTVDATGGGVSIMVVGIVLIVLAYYLPKPPKGIGIFSYSMKTLKGE